MKTLLAAAALVLLLTGCSEDPPPEPALSDSPTPDAEDRQRGYDIVRSTGPVAADWSDEEIDEVAVAACRLLATGMAPEDISRSAAIQGQSIETQDRLLAIAVFAEQYECPQ